MYKKPKQQPSTSKDNNIETLAFLHWQYIANKKAFENELITKSMYEYAKTELLKSIDSLEKLYQNPADVTARSPIPSQERICRTNSL